MRKTLIIVLCVSLFLFAACAEPADTQTAAPSATETETAAAVSPAVTQTSTPAPSPTEMPAPSPTEEPTPSPTPQPTQDLTAILGTWYCTTDVTLSIEFHANGTADFHGSPAECTGYEFNPQTKKGTIYLDDGGGPFPYDISITGGKLNLLGEKYSRTPNPNAAIVGTWYCTTDSTLSIEFHADGTADFHGSPAECTGYVFDSGSMTGTIYLDDGGGPFPYDISITGGKLNLLGEVYTR